MILKNGGADDGYAGSCLCDVLDVVHSHPSVDLETDVVTIGIDEFVHLPQLVQGGGSEALAAGAGVHAHGQDNVHLVLDIFEVVERGGGVSTSPDLQPFS